MNLIPRTLVLGIIGLATSSVWGQAGLTQGAAQTNRIYSSHAAGTNAIHHSMRWYEKPVNDPVTALKKLQRNAQDQLSDTPIFFQQEGVYTLVPAESNPTAVSAVPSDSGDGVTAWDDHPLYKDTVAVDFSAAGRYRGSASSFSNSPAVTLAEEASTDSRAIEFTEKTRAEAGSPEGSRVLEEDGLGGIPGSPSAQPQIASPEPSPVVLGAIFVGLWQAAAFLRRRR